MSAVWCEAVDENCALRVRSGNVVELRKPLASVAGGYWECGYAHVVPALAVRSIEGRDRADWGARCVTLSVLFLQQHGRVVG